MDWYAGYKLTKTIPHDVYSAIAIDRPDMAVTGQNVLISGGGTGIGLVSYLGKVLFIEESGSDGRFPRPQQKLSLRLVPKTSLSQVEGQNYSKLPLERSRL